MVYLLLVGWSGGVEEGWRIGGGREKRRAGEELENRRRAGEEEGWRRGEEKGRAWWVVERGT